MQHEKPENERATDSRTAELEEIAGLVEGLPQSHPVVRAASALVWDEPAVSLPMDAAIELLTTPSAPRWRERLLAAWMLGQGPLKPGERYAAVAALQAVLEKKLQPDQSDLYITYIKRALLLGVLVSVLYTLNFELEIRTLFYSLQALILSLLLLLLVLIPFFFVLSLPAVVLASNAAEKRHMDRLRAAAARTLGRLRAVEAVGAMAESLSDGSGAVRRAAADALKDVFPALPPRPVEGLRTQTIPRLCDALEQYDEAFDLAVLGALEKFGDRRAIPRMEYMKRMGRSEQIRQMADSLLPLLHERARQERDAARLLRPSGAPDSTDTLLRPACEITETPPEQLLRPASGEEEAG